MAVLHGKLARLYWWNKTATTLTDEATTEVTTTAQITDTAKRRLNPNAPPVFTDSGGKHCIGIDYINGIGSFDGTVTIVTVSGEYVLQANLADAGYIIDWTLNTSLGTADGASMGDQWDNPIAGRASWNGSANQHFQDSTFTDMISYETSPVEGRLYLIEFYVSAPAGLDRYVGWGYVTGANPTASKDDTVKQSIAVTGFRNIAYFTS